MNHMNTVSLHPAGGLRVVGGTYGARAHLAGVHVVPV